MPMLSSAICDVNNATGAEYSVPRLVSIRTHFQFKYRAFLSRSHLTSAGSASIFFSVGTRYYIHTRVARAVELPPSSASPELSRELITSPVRLTGSRFEFGTRKRGIYRGGGVGGRALRAADGDGERSGRGENATDASSPGP